jgi:hypothetical protein
MLNVAFLALIGVRMRFLTSLSLTTAVVPLMVVAGVGSLPLITSAYARTWQEGDHGASYQAPADDTKLNCKQLSGRAQVLILQLRGYDNRKQSSGLSRGLQSIFSSTVGTSPKGRDPDGQHAADLKRLQGYNQRLAAAGCKSYDLDYELKQTDPLVSPVPRIAPPKKSKVSPAATQKKQP